MFPTSLNKAGLLAAAPDSCRRREPSSGSAGPCPSDRCVSVELLHRAVFFEQLVSISRSGEGYLTEGRLVEKQLSSAVIVYKQAFRVQVQPY